MTRWMRVGRLVLLSVALLGGCELVFAANMLEKTRWKAFEVDLGTSRVEFSIPQGESKEFPNRPVPLRVDLASATAFDQASVGPTLLERAWDYRRGAVAVVDGTLHAHISVRRSEQALGGIEDLRHAVQESARLYAEKQHLETGRTPDSNDPVEFTEMTIVGRAGFLVRYRITSSRYVVPLDPHSYLVVSLRLNGFTNDAWRADAQRAAERILASIRITE